ncbi:response regulator transcription factor [Oxalobacter vibrioformis]|uniref:Response regulator transcription factor n=1 Tax=Oxalobacter vibrioformis TaxID=933080 RepID=A0A9E9P240_9BURK|nr:response regulator transcription factor [Oxalobacter vibrioformis]WAW09479.1 response regulator transcription factor [Oxalobacter vibrioformis]
MLILASASSEFFHKWDEVVSQPDAVVHVGSIDQLKALLEINTTRLIVLDMTVKDGKDPDILRAISEIKKGARLILSGIQFTPTAELSGLAVGAVACCSSSLSVAECRKILDVVQQGGVWLSSAGIPELLSKLRDFSARSSDSAALASSSGSNGAETAQPDEAVLSCLTKREREVARLVGSGASNKDIARQLDISDRTVKAHLTAIFDKLQVQDRLQLALRVSGRPPG